MVYNTVDIVKRACQLADLENSDFISYNENVQLLNEVYTKVYQKLINRADKAYLKTISQLEFNYDNINPLPENAIAIVLPPDFYQLNSVTYGLTEVPILRKAKTASPLTICAYDIVGDSLIIYGGGKLQDIKITYYPVPATLTIAAPDKPLDITNCLDMAGDYYLSYDPQQGGNAYIGNINDSSDNTVFTAVGAALSHVALDSAYSYTYTASDNKLHFLSKGASSEEVFSSNVAIHVHNPNGNMVLTPHSSSSGGIQEYDIWDISGPSAVETGRTFTLPDSTGIANYYAAMDETGNFYYSRQVSSGVYSLSVIDAVTKQIIDLYRTSGIAESIKVFFGQVYYKDNSGFKINGEPVINKKYIPVCVAGVDYDTGYGFLYKKPSGDAVLTSCFPDMEMPFPQNVYYTYVAYSLALSYAIKQGKDTSQLAAKVAEIENTFYDTIERDDNMPIRIANVYPR